VTARADALAAVERLVSGRGDREVYREPIPADDPDLALIITALAPELPADLAEIQARVDAKDAAWKAAEFTHDDDVTDAWHAAEMASADDVPALVAELAERRAALQLTAEEAREALSWAERLSEESDDWEPRSAVEAATAATLRAIAEQATS
jgi:hypothetical protein